MKDLDLSVLNARSDMAKHVARQSNQLDVLTSNIQKLIDAGFPVQRLPEVGGNVWYYSVENCTAEELNIARRAFGRLKKYNTVASDETHVIHTLIPATNNYCHGTINFKTKPIEYHSTGPCKIKKVSNGESLSLVCDNK